MPIWPRPEASAPRRSCKRPFQQSTRAAPHAVECVPGVVERAYAGRLQSIEAARASVAHGGTAPQRRRQKAFALEALECRVHGTGDDITLEASLYVGEDRAAVGAFSPTENGEKDRLFERSEDVCHVCLHCRHIRIEVQGRDGRPRLTRSNLALRRLE